MTSRSWAGRAKGLVLGLAALAGAVCLVLLVLGPLVGVRPLVVRSGSMEPAYPTGSLALTRGVAAADVGRGDVVVVVRAGARVMHRVVDASAVPGTDRVRLQLKGDANEVADADADEVSEVLLVVGHVPYAGAAVAWLARPPGVFLLGGYLAVCVWFVLRPDGSRGGADREVGAAADDR